MHPSTTHLVNLRNLFRAEGIDAYLVPSTDPHLNEYVPATWQRRRWLSGFTGSVGDLVVLTDRAALWVDGRYFLQAESELAGSGIDLMRQGEPGVPTLAAYLNQHLGQGAAVGIDPRLLSRERYRTLATEIEPRRILSLDNNLVDAVWKDRPPRPAGGLTPRKPDLCGARPAARLETLRTSMAERDCALFVTSNLAEIAWLLEARGTDVDYNPLALSYLAVGRSVLHLFVDGTSPQALATHLGNGMVLHRYDEVSTVLPALIQELTAETPPRIWLDQTSASVWLFGLLDGAGLILDESPLRRSKACKTPRELEGMRACHLRDGLAMVRFLHWFHHLPDKALPRERELAAAIDAERAKEPGFRGLSFNTIAGVDTNSAVIHYGTDRGTNAPLANGSVLLLDSGGQYDTGTTDITRTLCRGQASPAVRRAYTLVLKGLIAISKQRFPQGIEGIRLDALARQHLWNQGFDYSHGTGHGVGAALCVHENPPGISPRSDRGMPLLPGMITSLEPGYYQEGAFGIRLENLAELVLSDPTAPATSFLRFEELTLCPFEFSLLELALLEPAEVTWLNAYHHRVRTELAPHLSHELAAWLAEHCAALDIPG